MTLRWRIAQWFELKWWQNYLRSKKPAVYKQWKKDYWQAVYKKIKAPLRLSETSVIADLGCGPAGIFMLFNKNKVTAVDPLIDTYQAETDFFKKSDYAHVDFVNNTIEEFSAVQKFDVVFCMNAINHVHNIEEAFKKLRMICKDEGTIVISIDAHNFSLFKYLFRALPGDILHPHQYNLDEYSHLLSADGWQLKTTLLLKREFFFTHYLLLAQK
jgi:2-polyprenyl-3-methyl-5-hydroxy-6-metoxy-1,4-benzoquinol methylase